MSNINLLISIFILSTSYQYINYGQKLNILRKDTLQNCDKHLITKDAVDKIKIGMDISQVIKVYKDVKIETGDAGDLYLVYDKENLALMIWSKDEGKTVGGIEIYSANYELSNGIKVGTPIKYIKAIYPDMKIQIDFEDIEYFIPKDYLDDENTILYIYLKARNSMLLGNYSDKEADEFAEDFRIDGMVSHIVITSLP